jgi:hypothetical protein
MKVECGSTHSFIMRLNATGKILQFKVSCFLSGILISLLKLNVVPAKPRVMQARVAHSVPQRLNAKSLVIAQLVHCSLLLMNIAYL